jgi:hypothetical protein
MSKLDSYLWWSIYEAYHGELQGAGNVPGIHRLSYERPSIAVNKNGDMLFGYGRYPFMSEKTLHPEARYTLWYANEPKQRRSYLLREGEAANTRTVNTQIDYTTAVVDPVDDTSFWVALPFVNSNGGYRTIVGKISP